MASNASVATEAIFHALPSGQNMKNLLVGASPKPVYFGPTWPEVIGLSLGGAGLLFCGCRLRGLLPALAGTPIVRVMLPDRLIDIFLKGRRVLDTGRNAPQLFVQKLTKHHVFLAVLLIAEIAALAKPHLRAAGERTAAISLEIIVPPWLAVLTI